MEGGGVEPLRKHSARIGERGRGGGCFGQRGNLGLAAVEQTRGK
jgi:hypothetical protein